MVPDSSAWIFRHWRCIMGVFRASSLACSGSHPSSLYHLPVPPSFLPCTFQACDLGQKHLGTGPYRSDARLSITALRRGWIDWLHYCGFVWVFNWLINCGLVLRCDWLWVVSSGLESDPSKPAGWEVSSCGSPDMLVLLSMTATFISNARYSHTSSLPRSPLWSSFYSLV